MNKPKALKKSIRNNTILLDGMIGEFHSPYSIYTTKFFSTSASSRLGKAYETFLTELKPMRERMNSEDITSMEQVLQRDLDDYRVSKGLIPYLLNPEKHLDHVAFFPSILAVLMPKNYIRNIDKSTSTYPKGLIDQNHDEIITEYKGKNTDGNDVKMWELTHWKIDDNELSPLGQLLIDLDEAEIVVIDGQHRANAFRVVTNSFFSTSNDNAPYEIFYSNYKTLDFKADLPVTIIWFEINNELIDEVKDKNSNAILNHNIIKPEIVTRRIFIDVNNSARKVNFNRELLMNDREPSSYLTSCFYSIVASQYGFKFQKDLSLGHLGFDLPVSLSENPNLSCTTITCPEIIHAIIDWTFFSSGYYANNLNAYEVKRDKKRDNLVTFNKYFRKSPKYVSVGEDLSSERGNIIKRIKPLEKETHDIIREEFGELGFLVIYRLINEFILTRKHIEAAELYEKEIYKKATVDYKYIWESVYKGGEGLFYTYQMLIKDANHQNNDSVKIVNTIEKEFKDLRFNTIDINGAFDLKTLNSCFKTISTFAFQIAFINSFYSFCSFVLKYDGVDFYKPEKLNDGLDEFIKRINDKGTLFWVNFLTEFKNFMIGDLTPKLWPSFHKLILRSIQNENEIFNRDNQSPEQYVFETKYSSLLRSFLRQKYGREEIKKMTVDELIQKHGDDLSKIQQNINSEIEAAFDKVKLELIKYDHEMVLSQIHSQEVGINN